MAPVQLKYVVSFSSQDSRHPAENLLHVDINKKWLCVEGEKSGRLEAEFQMEKACGISHLDIGAHFVFSVQVLVGRSSWPSGHEYATLLPSSIFTNPSDIRIGKNKSVVRMFKQGDFDAVTASQKWDRIRVVCCQPFRKDVQFGLSLLKVISDDEKVDEPSNVPEPFVAKSLNSSAALGSSPSSSGNKEKVSSASPSLSNTLSKIAFSPRDRSQNETPKKGLMSSDGHYSRAGQMLMAATGRSVQFKPPSQMLPVKSPIDRVREVDVESMPRKKQKTIEEEIKEFVNSVDYRKLNLKTFTYAVAHLISGEPPNFCRSSRYAVPGIAVEPVRFGSRLPILKQLSDLRHQLEKQKMRKLSKDERKMFIELATKAIENFVHADETGGKKVVSDTTKNSPFATSDMKRLPVGNVDAAKSRSSEVKGVAKSPSAANLSHLPKSIIGNSDMSLFGSQDDILGTASMQEHLENHMLPSAEVSFEHQRRSKSTQSHAKRKLLDAGQEVPSKLKNKKLRKMSKLVSEILDSPDTNNVWLSKSSPSNSTFSLPNLDKKRGGSSRLADLKRSTCALGASEPGCQIETEVFCIDSDDEPDNKDSGVTCPLCLTKFPADVIAVHASNCCL